jgi:hypothetical protein
MIMRSLRNTGLCLAAALVSLMSLAASASAAPPLWLLCLKRFVIPGLYNDSNCKEFGGTFEWESEGLPPGGIDTIRITDLTIVMRDSNVGPLNENGLVTCLSGGRGSGLLTSPKESEIRSAALENAKTNCARLSGPCKAGEVEEMKGVNLPWKQILVETESKTLSYIRGGGSGNPGWSLKCNTALGSKTDTCTNTSEKPESMNDINEVTGGILLIRSVLTASAHGNCTEANGGKKETGELHGLTATLSANGDALSINLTT